MWRGQFLDAPEPPPAAFPMDLQNVQYPTTQQRLSYDDVTTASSPVLMATSFGYIGRGGSVPLLLPQYNSSIDWLNRLQAPGSPLAFHAGVDLKKLCGQPHPHLPISVDLEGISVATSVREKKTLKIRQ
jgi:hypothetical protein